MKRITVSFRGKEYPIIEFTNSDDNIDYVAEESLWNALMDGYYNGDKECERIDNMIFYFFPNGTFEETDEFIECLIKSIQ